MPDSAGAELHNDRWSWGQKPLLLLDLPILRAEGILCITWEEDLGRIKRLHKKGDGLWRPCVSPATSCHSGQVTTGYMLEVTPTLATLSNLSSYSKSHDSRFARSYEENGASGRHPSAFLLEVDVLTVNLLILTLDPNP